jgi:Tol biopolymer transport system component
MYDNNLIGLVNADGSGPRLVTQGAAVTVPVWSPDGRRLAYRESRGPLNTIFSVDVTDGSAPVAVVREPGTLGAPVWSPDGRRIAYLLPGEGTFVVDVTQANPTPERLPGSPFGPVAWAAEGRLLLGNRPASATQAVAPLLYDFGTSTSELVAETGAGVRLSADGSQILVNDGGTKLQMIDRSAQTIRDLFSVTPPSTFSFGLTPNSRSLFYVVTDVQADIYQIRVP